MSGFGARRQDGPVISYILVYRTKDGRQRTYTIGKHGSPWSPDTARQEARRVLGEVVKGADPVADKIAGRKAITVAELCQQYMADVEAGRLLTRRKIAKKELTLISDRGRIDRHIIPLLGRMPVMTVRRNDVERFMHDVAAGKTAGQAEDQATRSLGRAWRSWRRRAHRRHCSVRSSPTPCARVFGSTIRRMASSDSPKAGEQRRLTDDEYRQLGKALSMADRRMSGSQPSPPRG